MPRDCRPRAQLRGLSFSHLYRQHVSATFSPPALASHSTGASCPAAWPPRPRRSPHVRQVPPRAVHFPEHWGRLERGSTASVCRLGLSVRGESRPRRLDAHRNHVHVGHASCRQSGPGRCRERTDTTVNRPPDRGWPCLACQSPGSSEASRRGGCVLGAGDPTMSRSRNAASRWLPASSPLLMARAPSKCPHPALLSWGGLRVQPPTHVCLPDAVCTPRGRVQHQCREWTPKPQPQMEWTEKPSCLQTLGTEAWMPQGGVGMCPRWRA